MSNARLRSNLHFKRTYDGKDVVEPYAMLDVLHTKIAPSGTLRTHSLSGRGAPTDKVARLLSTR